MTMFKNGKLRDAAAHNDVKLMTALLNEGADPNTDDSYYGSALYRAVVTGSTEAVKLLLDRGAKPDVRWRNHSVPMARHAAEQGRHEVLKLLLDADETLATGVDGAGNGLLHYAAAEGRLPVVRLLLDRDAALAGIRNNEGEEPLHAAAKGGHAEVVALLLERGANPDVRNKSNRTPLFLAQKQSHGEVVEILKPVTPAVRVRAEADPSREWIKMSGNRIAHISMEEAIGYRITEIFNFESRERTIIHQNLETRAETAQTLPFDQLGEKNVLETALAELQQHGGTADASRIGGLSKKRLAP